VPKHDGITMMVIDMHAEGVEVRPLKMTNGGNSEFNEVFFRRRVRARRRRGRPGRRRLDRCPRHARQRERQHRRRGRRHVHARPEALLSAPFDAHPERLGGGAARLGATSPPLQAMGLLNLRSANRAVAGGEPGPEGAMTKLVLSEIGHEAAAILTELNGPDAAFMDGRRGHEQPDAVLMHRGMSIAGGTSEIKRNQIGERILGLPRDPLINSAAGADAASRGEGDPEALG
jgi:alkylation response protein AidB-like acyl-CoA dehydrogenase